MFVQVGEVWHDGVYIALARKQKQMACDQTSDIQNWTTS